MKASFLMIVILSAALQLFGQDTVLLKPTKECEHFVFYSTSADVGVLDTLAVVLENNYDQITSHLGVQINKKTQVNIYPSVAAFHAVIDFPDAPEWVVGKGDLDSIMMVSPLNPGSMHSFESLMQTVVHEFVHTAVFYAQGEKDIKEMPKWLSEGYAFYEAGQTNDYIRDWVEKAVAEETPPSWTHLDTVSDMEFGNIGGYQYSATITEYLIVTYGMEKIVQFIKQPEQMESIYGLSMDALEKKWLEYVKG